RLVLLQLLLGRAGHRTFRHGVDAIRQDAREIELVLDVERVDHRDARLLPRGRGQRGEADHVAGRVDVRDFALILVVDLDEALRAGLQADLVEAQVVRAARAARRDAGRADLARLAPLQA